MISKTLLENLQEINTWWATGKTEKEFDYEREELSEIVGLLGDKRATIVAGPRQVGKSTMMIQTITYLLKSGVKPACILSFSCDDANLFNGKTAFEDVLAEYERNVLFASLSTVKERIYILIDEAQALKNWNGYIKTYQERNERIKFIVSGSSAALLFEGANESLYGRHDMLYIYPLRFWQFARLSQGTKDDHVLNVYNQLPKVNLFLDPIGYFDELQKIYNSVNIHYPEMNGLLRTYLTVGGYPEYCFSQTEIMRWQSRLVNDVVASGLYKDIIKVFKIESPKKLEQIFYFIAANSGQPFSYNTIGSTVGLNVETAANYITYLEKAKLIMVQPVYSANTAKTLRANKKLHVLDNGICNAMMRTSSPDDARLGFAVETAMTAYAASEAEKNLWQVCYRDAKEVDIVLDKKQSILPIEVKYRNEVRTGKNENWQDLSGSQSVVVVTKTHFAKEGNVLYIPFWLVK